MRILASRVVPDRLFVLLARGLVWLLVLVGGLSGARADLVPMPPPECEGKPDGSFCGLGDGTAGACATVQDARRPGRSYRTCKKDPNECDRLEVGAVCHGYLGKPSHCREFENAETKKRWRTCQADEVTAPAAASPTPAAAAPPAAAPPPPTAAPASAEPAPVAAPKPRGLLGCSQTADASPAGLSVVAMGLALVVLRRRRPSAAR
jgi:MYXO-CTERM domain-containing protein